MHKILLLSLCITLPLIGKPLPSGDRVAFGDYITLQNKDGFYLSASGFTLQLLKIEGGLISESSKFLVGPSGAPREWIDEHSIITLRSMDGNSYTITVRSKIARMKETAEGNIGLQLVPIPGQTCFALKDATSGKFFSSATAVDTTDISKAMCWHVTPIR